MLQHSLAGAKITMINYGRPLKERAKARKRVGPYYWTVPEASTKTRDGVGFYMGRGLEMDSHGSSLRLRIEDANQHLSHNSRARGIRGYYCDDHCEDTIKPIIARLPHGRGFLAGWTFGDGMASGLDSQIYGDIEGAAYAAHEEARICAERNREMREQDEDDEDGDE